jgi:hypothetical protein
LTAELTNKDAEIRQLKDDVTQLTNEIAQLKSPAGVAGMTLPSGATVQNTIVSWLLR